MCHILYSQSQGNEPHNMGAGSFGRATKALSWKPSLQPPGFTLINISESLLFEWNFFQTFASVHFYYVYGFPHDVCMCTMCVLGGFGQQERL